MKPGKLENRLPNGADNSRRHWKRSQGVTTFFKALSVYMDARMQGKDPALATDQYGFSISEQLNQARFDLHMKCQRWSQMARDGRVTEANMEIGHPIFIDIEIPELR